MLSFLAILLYVGTFQATPTRCHLVRNLLLMEDDGPKKRLVWELNGDCKLSASVTELICCKELQRICIYSWWQAVSVHGWKQPLTKRKEVPERYGRRSPNLESRDS